jgi:hypothetical protein
MIDESFTWIMLNVKKNENQEDDDEEEEPIPERHNLCGFGNNSLGRFVMRGQIKPLEKFIVKKD